MTSRQKETSVISADPLVVDARGHRCPVPTLRLRKALAGAAPGQVVRLLADDPMARIDVPHFAAQHGCQVLASAAHGDLLIFELVKAT
jgi:tRNA 2-thiouridine synthesizing protein A